MPRWSLWDFRELEWTFPAFFYLLLAPTLLYVGVSLLIGAGDPALRGSAGESFEQVRLPFLGVMGLFHVLASVDGLLLGAETAWNSLRLVQLMTFAAYVAGMLWAERRVQRLVAGAVLGGIIGGGHGAFFGGVTGGVIGYAEAERRHTGRCTRSGGRSTARRR